VPIVARSGSSDLVSRAIDVSVPGGPLVPGWAVTDGPVPRGPLVDFTATVFRRLGARASDARLTAETLVLADVRGHPSHGVSRLRQYTRLLTSGSIDPVARHERVARRSAFETWDAHHGLGPAVGHRAMDRAIAMARRAGIGAVTVRDAGHFGMAGAYVLRALDAGMVALTIGNATAGVPPTGGVEPAVGTNPIAIGAPDGRGQGFLLDMATSVVALGKVEVAQRAGRAIPVGWGMDAHGRPTTDPAAILAGGMLLPLGGPAETGGYKGYGLASAVDILTGVLGGGTFGLDVTGLWDTGASTTSSQLHLSIDPAVGGEPGAFAARLRAWREQVVTRGRASGVAEILVAGDPEWRASARQAERVELLPEVIRDLATLAIEHRLLPAWRPVVAR
jgi:LDH2 family malate/lactate/ureidoglycolate dehydrogenase